MQGDKNQIISLWDPRDGTRLRTIYEHKGEVSVCRWNKVSHKALPLPCVSTVFLSKTVPFLAVWLHSKERELAADGRAGPDHEALGHPAGPFCCLVLSCLVLS
eukprot:SAG22_NODE_111_length_19607_cov_12.696637_3_plen_103_part_00